MKDFKGKEIEQGDIYWIDFNPTKGAEINKLRPAIVVQDQNLLKHSRTILVCPIISSDHIHPMDVELGNTDLKNNSWARTIQMKSVDISRFKSYLTRISSEKIEEVLDTFLICLGR